MNRLVFDLLSLLESLVDDGKMNIFYSVLHSLQNYFSNLDYMGDSVDEV